MYFTTGYNRSTNICGDVFRKRVATVLPPPHLHTSALCRHLILHYTVSAAMERFPFSASSPIPTSF